MRKKVSLLMFLLILSLSIFLVARYGMEGSKSQNEIRILRTQYPVNDKAPENIELFDQSFEEMIQICDCFVEVEIASEPIVYTKKITIDPNTPEGAVHEKAGGLTEFQFVKYIAKVNDNVVGQLEQTTIELTYNANFDVCMPTMAIGDRFLVGGVHNTKYDTLDIGHNTMFYVTEDDYVLSVQSETSRNRHSGEKIDRLITYIKSVKEKQNK